jgi:hypothetical protein
MPGTLLESWPPGATIGLVATLGGLLIAFAAVVLSILAGWSATSRRLALKRMMVERGMSAAEIDLVMRAGTSQAALTPPPTSTLARNGARVPLSELVDTIASYEDTPEPERVVRALREIGALDPVTLTVAAPTAEVVLKLAANGTSAEQLEAVVLALPHHAEPALAAAAAPQDIKLEVHGGEHLMR